MTKAEVMSRINEIAEMANANDNGYHYEVITTYWSNYGKIRTYFAIIETRDNSKHSNKLDYGYYDDAANKYVAGKKSLNYTVSGARIA